MKRSTGNINLHSLFLVLAHIINGNKLTTHDLAKKTGLSRPTVTRILTKARALLGMKIVTLIGPGNAHFKIEDWGVLNPVTTKKKLSR